MVEICFPSSSAKCLTVDTLMIFLYLQQFENRINVSREKKLEKYHDPLAHVAHTGSSFRNTSSYYVTHPTSVVDYEDEYQQDDVHTNSEDSLASTMLLLARAITQKNFTPTNNASSALHPSTKKPSNHSRRPGGIFKAGTLVMLEEIIGNTSTVQCYNCSGKGLYARNYPKPRVQDSKYFMEQMLLAKQDEARVILTDEHNDFLLLIGYQDRKKLKNSVQTYA
ncbi:hypothetical protein Tco_1042236 [Tanacetum coccineum]|uniref:Uncharacterized protein n=1 Tax=Tanacetum coccineum TaxID=301880 RepID=A0ABQ5GIG0_9ASTR